jgi:hypothetical protein
VIRARVDDLRASTPVAEAKRLAAAWLPDGVAPEVRLHVVLGGRAGAAAIGADIYFDVLAASYAERTGRTTFPTPGEIVDFFAHETHHVGMSVVISALREKVVLDERAARAFEFVTMVTEGSATYLLARRYCAGRSTAASPGRPTIARSPPCDAIRAGCAPRTAPPRRRAGSTPRSRIASPGWDATMKPAKMPT